MEARATILVPYVALGRKQVRGKPWMFGLYPANRVYDTKQAPALGSYRPLHLQVNNVETEGGHINSPGHPGPEGQTFPL